MSDKPTLPLSTEVRAALLARIPRDERLQLMCVIDLLLELPELALSDAAQMLLDATLSDEQRAFVQDMHDRFLASEQAAQHD